MNWRLFIATLLHVTIFILVLWWMIFAVSLIDRYEPHMIQHRNMLLWEGGTLLLLVGLTAALTIYLFLRDEWQMRRLREFVAGFTHDLKTALARVRLQTESLRADNRDPALNEMFNRLTTDTSRLETQVQNSLFVGALDGGGRSRQNAKELHVESHSLRSLVDLLKDSWPQVNVACDFKGGRDVVMNVDGQAMESVLNNLVHNSIVHGRADRIQFEVSPRATDRICLRIGDNGRGFQGETKRLGQMFFRHNPSSGSGLGLFTVKSYVERMNGAVRFTPPDDRGRGFVVELELPGAIQT